MEIKINKEIPGYKIDQIVQVATDKENIPLDHFWRRRLKDAVIDNCCEVLKPAPKQKQKKLFKQEHNGD